MKAHSKFSASGAERWLACPGSVNLSEGIPDISSKWAEEGIEAHKVLEEILIYKQIPPKGWAVTEMKAHAANAANFLFKLHEKCKGSTLFAEQRVHLKFIHPEAFGTLDAAVVELFGTLHIIDFKYGAGVLVSAIENLQMIFYALAVAHDHQWNFQKVRLWIIQPRISGYDGPTFWEISIEDLEAYADVFRKGIARVEKEPSTFVEGTHCHWCKAKKICPLKQEKRLQQARNLFKPVFLRG